MLTRWRTFGDLPHSSDPPVRRGDPADQGEPADAARPYAAATRRMPALRAGAPSAPPASRDSANFLARQLVTGCAGLFFFNSASNKARCAP